MLLTWMEVVRACLESRVAKLPLAPDFSCFPSEGLKRHAHGEAAAEPSASASSHPKNKIGGQGWPGLGTFSFLGLHASHSPFTRSAKRLFRSDARHPHGGGVVSMMTLSKKRWMLARRAYCTVPSTQVAKSQAFACALVRRPAHHQRLHQLQGGGAPARPRDAQLEGGGGDAGERLREEEKGQCREQRGVSARAWTGVTRRGR